MNESLIMGWTHNQWVHAITVYDIKTGGMMGPCIAGLVELKDWWVSQYGLYPPTGEVSSPNGDNWARAATFALKTRS